MSVSYIAYSDATIGDYDAIVVGAGFAGSVIARELAERGGFKILILEKRSHIAGNMYDERDSAGILVQRFGPHVFHTDSESVWRYVNRFCTWHPYEHHVIGYWKGKAIPIPFNIDSIEAVFPAKTALRLERTLVDTFGENAEMSITDLTRFEDPDLKELAEFVHDCVFTTFTLKQWGISLEDLDPGIAARVPVRANRDGRAFTDRHQGVPEEGYTAMFERMLDYPGIDIALETDATSKFDLQFQSGGVESPCTGIRIKDEAYTGEIIYTGPIDELFLWRFSRLAYRSVRFKFENRTTETMLPCGTVNYITDDEKATRITEFKHITGQKASTTTTVKEYPEEYTDPETQVPCYAILSNSSKEHYRRYAALVANLPNFHLLGRLAEYNYYNMDTIVERSLHLADELLVKMSSHDHHKHE